MTLKINFIILNLIEIKLLKRLANNFVSFLFQKNILKNKNNFVVRNFVVVRSSYIYKVMHSFSCQTISKNLKTNYNIDIKRSLKVF